MAYNRRTAVSIVFAPVATDGGYTTGQVVGEVTKLENALEDTSGVSELRCLVAKDASNSKIAMDLVFFNQIPASSVGVDGATYDLADSDLGKVAGRVSIATADYVSSGSVNAEATIRNIGLLMQGLKRVSGQTGRDLWVVAVIRGSLTCAPTDLSVLLTFEKY